MKRPRVCRQTSHGKTDAAAIPPTWLPRTAPLGNATSASPGYLHVAVDDEAAVGNLFRFA